MWLLELQRLWPISKNDRVKLRATFAGPCRRYLPKGTPITSHQPYLDAIAYELNNCPRATLGYRTPTEAFNELIATIH